MAFARVAALVVLLLAAFPNSAAAADVRQGTVMIPADATVDDDLYAFGDSVTILGTVKGDVVAIGASVRVDGTVTGDLIASANTITVHGQVGGSVRAAAMTIAIDGKVGGDAFVAANDVTIAQTGRIGRDMYVAAGTFTQSGEVVRDVRSATGTTVIDGHVGRNVESDADTVRVTARGVVDGKLRYASPREVAIVTGGTVKGQVERRDLPPPATGAAGTGTLVLNWLRGGVGLLILGLALVFFFPGFSRRAGEALVRSPVKSLAFGIAGLIGLPILALLALALGAIVGGAWLAIAVIGFYLASIAVSLPIAALGLGALLYSVTRRPAVPAIALVVGLILLLLVGVVPFVGALVVAIAAVLGLGATIMAVAGGRRPDAQQQPMAVV